MRRRIAIFTGNRAEYGLQFPIIQAIAVHPDLDYHLLVAGTHLDGEFGATAQEIINDGFHAHSKIRMEISEDSLEGTAEAIGRGILALHPIFKRLRPDVLLVYGDRFETFSAAIAGSQMGIPTAHVEGGDITEGGALDDSVRHAITKLSHLHFATNEEAARRVRALGEEPWRVFDVGFPVLDLIYSGKYAPPEKLVDHYGIDLHRPLIVFTQHSVTTEVEQAADQIRPSLRAIELLASEGYQVIVTYPNSDAGGRQLIREIEALNQREIPGVQVHKSVGRHHYHGLLNLCCRVGRGVCVGNSSSGIKETAAFGCPAVNIGSRQNGRLRATNVIDVGYDCENIVEAIRYSVNDAEFRKRCSECDNPYGMGNAGIKIASILSSVDLGKKLLQKRMMI